MFSSAGRSLPEVCSLRAASWEENSIICRLKLSICFCASSSSNDDESICLTLTKHQGRKEELGKNLSEEFVLQYAQVDVNQLNEQRQKLLAVLEKRNAVLAERNAVLSKQNAVLFQREGERNSCKQNLETIIGETYKCESEIERQIDNNKQ